MSQLLDKPPFAPRDEQRFLKEMNELTAWHLRGCQPYQRIWPKWQHATRIQDLPYLHVGVFKHVLFKTRGPELKHERTLTSSSTTANKPSKIVLDSRSSALQGKSSQAILEEVVGKQKRPLLIVDSAKSLRGAGEISARIAAALSLKPVASSIYFLLDDADNPESMNWERLRCVLRDHDHLLVYGITWILWFAWGNVNMPQDIRQMLSDKRIHFVHSGGWKKLETMRIDRTTFDSKLLDGVSEDSRVIDFYGLVEQIGVIYPLCGYGFRHVPRWANVLVRNIETLDIREYETGLLQFMNVLSYGAPYHNALTEDIGRLIEGPCPCGWAGPRFELLGRLPKSEVRGCANV